MTVEAPSIPASLAPAVCANCGYSLTGLTGTRVCPECGREYDESEVVLHGWARGRHENLGNTKRTRIVLMLFGSFAWIAVQLPSLALGGTRYDLLIFAAAMMVPVGLLLFRRSDSGHPGLIQVRLSDRGCVQYDNLHAPSAIGELARSHGWVVPLVAAIVLLILPRDRMIDPIQFWIWFPLSIIAVPIAWRVSRKFRVKIREVRSGSIADANSVSYNRSPWTDVGSYSLKPARKANYRLRIDTFTKFFGNDVVDAEIACTPEQAESLRDLLDGWIRAGKKQRDAGEVSAARRMIDSTPSS
ncbi:MAG: hypothetical protein JWP03_5176 [Phycisphaerales bacterium]|jgi:hypothetical protein|nr:hypothetical protein [Phycisphaerales bacterium]